MNTIDWLFELAPAGWHPQVVLADESKRALVWLPGNKLVAQNRIERLVNRAKYMGCTQLAFRSRLELMTNQPCVVCWAGIDVDDEPIDDAKLLTVGGGTGSLRSSCGGRGRHLLFRLAEPIECRDKQHAGVVVKAITVPLVAEIESLGMAVCKADCRAFYLMGGLNRWIRQTDALYAHSNIIPMAPVEWDIASYTSHGFDITVSHNKEIISWLKLFLDSGVMRSLGTRNPIYIGRAVEVLRAHGEVVETKSGCSGNGQINGYIDFGPTWIQVWSYADGHAIWRYVAI